MARKWIFDSNRLPVKCWLSYFFVIVCVFASWSPLLAADELAVADIYFKDGRVEKHVTIVSRTELKVKYRLTYGEVTAPMTAIEKLDPPNAGLKDAPPAESVPAAAAPAPAAEIIPGVAAPAPTTSAPPPAEAQPTAPPAETAPPTATAPATTGGENSAVPSPAPAATQATSASAEPTAATPPPVPTVEAAAVPSTPPPAETASADRKSSVKFGFLLFVWLVLATLWMQSVQWVQNHLAIRKADPKFWTLAALLLPGVGAGAYAAVMKMSGQELAIETPGAPSSPSRSPLPPPPAPAPLAPAPQASPTIASRFPLATPPPVEKPQLSAAAVGELVRKIRTPRGFEFIDAAKRFTSNDEDLAKKLEKGGSMIDEALFERASDVHIEPTAEDYRVRFRLDGLLQERMRYEKADGHLILAALKKIGDLDAAEELKPQEGRFQMRSGDRGVDLRVATSSSFHGEKMVIRLLDHSQSGFTFASLGMDEKSLEVFTEILQARDGAILATGPNGAGKTSTLYAALRTMDVKRLNIMTIEDPPEYELPGTTQITVTPNAGITYENGLQSIMRQDPDVILIGEIRDAAIMKTALSAVIGGHLVLSSFNALSTLSTITRLREMGIENYQIASAVRLILSQRLVRVLCQNCRHPFPAKGTELLSLGMELEPGTILYAATGCEHCMDSGYHGREAIFEMLVIDDSLRRAIADGASEDALAAIAIENSFHSFHFNGAQKVMAGITTVEELINTN